LAAKLGLPVVELDAIVHAHAGWVDLSREDFRERLAAVLAKLPDGWIIDGNYHRDVGDIALGQADTALWLRLPFRTVYWRLARRTLRRARTGEELWNGNRETWRQLLTTDSMLWWGIKAWRPATRKVRTALATVPHHARVVVLRRPAQVKVLLERATVAPPAAAARDA